MYRIDRHPMTPLRQRYIDDLRLRNKSPRTIETYVLRVAQFAKHFKRSPEQLGPKELRAYQQHLLARQVSWSMFNQSVCALRFLYNVTLGRPHLIVHLPFAKRPRLLPTVLSPEEVVRFLEAALPGRDRTLLELAYGCGLRLKELLGLQVADIDSARMVLHIRHGKGQKERLAPLTPRLLGMLRAYWREYRPATWLFPGVKPALALTDGTVHRHRPLQGLRRRSPSQDDDAGCRRVPASLRAARVAEGIYEDPPLRSAGPSPSRGAAGIVSSSAAGGSRASGGV